MSHGAGMAFAEVDSNDASCVQARDVCPSDPLVANELGVLAFRNRQLDAAIQHFTTALKLLPPKAAAGEVQLCADYP